MESLFVIFTYFGGRTLSASNTIFLWNSLKVSPLYITIMIKTTSVLLLTSLLLIGCGSSDKEEDNKTTGPTGYIKNLSNAKNNAQTTAAATTLNKAVQQFEAMEGELPKSLNELVSKNYISSIPAPPPNMRIEYNNKTGAVTLLSQ
jgi:hypothetical protein